jgi:hypothetical protein
MIFVDTGGWFAYFIPDDPDYAVATAWMKSRTAHLATTDYILDELLTLLRARGHKRRAIEIGTAILEQTLGVIEKVEEDDIERAWTIFRDYDDKDWSFTDGVSFAVMERLGVTTAFSFDQHFHQRGLVVVPQV